MELKEITVERIDLEKLNDELNKEHLPKEMEKPFKYRILEHDLCVATSKKGTKAIFDTELVGTITKDDVFEFDVIRVYEDKTMDMSPVGLIKLSGDEIKNFLGESTDVPEFMGRRHNYNTRVKSNQSVFLNFIINE